MKKIFLVNKTSEGINIALLLTRVAIAVLMLVHGVPKMGLLFSGDTVLFPSVFGLTPALSLSLTVFAEVLCSVFILAGFATRLAVVPLIVTMLIAVLVIHDNDPFSNKELALHYLVTYLVLLIAGSGKYSLDYLLYTRTDNNYKRVKEEDPTLAIYS